jgi:hypothetical protein
MRKQPDMAMRTGSASTMIAATILAALLLALAAMPAKPAGATFLGNNGRIAFASDRTTGEGVNNPGGDFEIMDLLLIWKDLT